MKPPQQATAEGILFTDQYQLTMAQLYYRTGLHEKPALFEHFFRRYPDYGAHQAGYCVNAGMGWLLDWMHRAHFRDEDVACLRSHRTQVGTRLFGDDFLYWLQRHGSFEALTVRSIPEGRVVHPNEPLTVVEGPLAMAQILESPLLNQLNYPILVATKAARLREAGEGRPLLEFGMRRGQASGVNVGVRAALIGGADFSSNAGVSHVLGYPPKGTHAHSMVQAFMALGGGELEAFRAYAEVYPDDCLLLVDTIDTLESGLPHAIQVFEELRRKGHRPAGIRLDSGDLAHLSIQAAKMLDDAGFCDASIVLSNQLDELVIWHILTQIRAEAPQYGVAPDALIRRLVYGVGTQLITSGGHSALDGVYKLVAVEDQGRWIPVLKVSETLEKVPNPGRKRLWRIYEQELGRATADLLSLESEDPRSMDPIILRHPTDRTKWRSLPRAGIADIQPLLAPAWEEGRPVGSGTSIEEMRQRRRMDLDQLDPGVRRLVHPHCYHVSLTQALWTLKQELVDSARAGL